MSSKGVAKKSWLGADSDTENHLGSRNPPSFRFSSAFDHFISKMFENLNLLTFKKKSSKSETLKFLGTQKFPR